MHLLELVILLHVLLGRLTSTLRLLLKGFVGGQQCGLLGDESHQASKQAAIVYRKEKEEVKATWLAGWSQPRPSLPTCLQPRPADTWARWGPHMPTQRWCVRGLGARARGHEVPEHQHSPLGAGMHRASLSTAPGLRGQACLSGTVADRCGYLQHVSQTLLSISGGSCCCCPHFNEEETGAWQGTVTGPSPQPETDTAAIVTRVSASMAHGRDCRLLSALVTRYHAGICHTLTLKQRPSRASGDTWEN